MFTDRNRSSPGLRALLGRLLHGLLPHRFLQLVAAAWSYLMGPWEALSLLPSGWSLHRSVRSGELPEVLEVLALRTGSWEDLEECFDELGPWKELITPEVGVDLDLKSWKGVSSSKDEESAFKDLSSWKKAMAHSNMQVFWEPRLTSWNDVIEPNQDDKPCHKTASASHTDQTLDGDIEPCKVAHEKNGTPLQASSIGIISYILNVGTSGVLNRVEWKDDQNMDAIVDHTCQSECEIQHIRNKRLRFLQQSSASEGLTSDIKQEGSEKEQSQTIVTELPNAVCFTSPNQPISNLRLDLSMSDCPESQSQIVSDHCQLVSDVCMTQGDVLELPEMNDKCSSLDQLPVVLQEVDNSDNLQHICPSSPDKDQGYHSLEYWQCSPLPQNVTTANIETLKTCELDRESVLFALPVGLPACPSFGSDKNDDQNSEDLDFYLQGDIPVSSVSFCTNKHIGYILGTVVSDDDTSSLSEDEWNKEEEEDDGFDSERSMSSTDSEAEVPEAVLWNSFCSADPYNLQNFTASLQTGVMTEETSLSLETLEQHQSDEESWCDSNAESGSDGESDCSADEEENLKLWNAFLKSDDPYNPLYFKAPVQTSGKKRQSSESISTYSETLCRPLPNHQVTLVTCQAYDLQQLQFKETHNVPVEDSAILGHKKVTFHEKVTIHYVCDEEERKGHWEELARDRCRFQRRIKETEFVIGHCLAPDHRQRAWERMQGQKGS